MSRSHPRYGKFRFRARCSDIPRISRIRRRDKYMKERFTLVTRSASTRARFQRISPRFIPPSLSRPSREDPAEAHARRGRFLRQVGNNYRGIAVDGELVIAAQRSCIIHRGRNETVTDARVRPPPRLPRNWPPAIPIPGRGLGKTALPWKNGGSLALRGMPDDLITRARVPRILPLASRTPSTPLDASRRRDKKFRADGRSSRKPRRWRVGSRIRARYRELTSSSSSSLVNQSS